jgi:IS66 Orf2 like protein
MIGLRPGLPIWIATQPVDFRRGMDSLAMLVSEAFGADPFDGGLYIFRSKRPQLVSLCVLLSDPGQADHPIVLIINVVFRPTFDHALHRYAYCFRRQRVDRNQPLRALDCLCGRQDALEHQALC